MILDDLDDLGGGAGAGSVGGYLDGQAAGLCHLLASEVVVAHVGNLLAVNPAGLNAEVAREDGQTGAVVGHHLALGLLGDDSRHLGGSRHLITVAGVHTHFLCLGTDCQCQHS